MFWHHVSVSVLFLQNRAQSHARQMTMFFHDPVPELESMMLINYALQFEATNNYLYPKKCLMQEGEKPRRVPRLLRQVKGLVTMALFLNSWLCALRSVSSNDFVRSIAYKLQSACFDDLGCAYGHNASLQYLERLPQLQWHSSARFIDTWGPYATFPCSRRIRQRKELASLTRYLCMACRC